MMMSMRTVVVMITIVIAIVLLGGRQLGLAVIMLVCAIGGCWWPLFYEPLWLQQAAHVMPTAWAMDALTNLVSRGRGLAEVAPQVGVLTAYGALSAALGVRLHRL